MNAHGNNRQNHYDAVVVGAGVIGLTLALGLAKKNAWKVALLEKNKQPQALSSVEERPRNIRATAIGLPSSELLDELGVWQMLNMKDSFAYQQMHVWDENSDGELVFNANDYALDALGHIVDHDVLGQHLYSLVQQHQLIDLFYDSELLNIESSDLTNTLKIAQANNASLVELSTQWVFAADGANSQTRHLIDIGVSQYDYRQLGLVCKIQTQLSHQSTAWQCFTPTGPLALLPLSNGECSIVWSLDKKLAREKLTLSDREFAHQIQMALQSRLGQVTVCSQRVAFPLKSIRVEQYVKDSVVLVGDSAHAIHPMSGQGANLGFSDVITLLKQLSGKRAGDSEIRQSLRRYEREQKLKNHLIDTFQTNLDRLFSKDVPLVNSLRGIGLKAVNQNSLIKSLFAKQVLGK